MSIRRGTSLVASSIITTFPIAAICGPSSTQRDRDVATLLGAHVEYLGNPYTFDVIARHIL